MKFLVITEKNSWEAETWSFLFKDTPLNRKSFEFAKKTLKDDSTYSFTEEDLSVDQIEEKKNCKNTFYMNRYNFMKGDYDFEKGFEKLDEDDRKDPFYKGQYERFRVKSPEGLSKSQ